MKKILVIDDDPGIVALLEKRLAAAGFDMLSALDGKAGVERMRAEVPALVILDVMMAGMDGYSFLLEVRSDEKTRDIPLVVITARGDLGDLFRSEHVAAFFQKPLNIEALLEKINVLIGS